MAMKKFKPYTPSRRTMANSDYKDITSTEPEKSLLEPLNKTAVHLKSDGAAGGGRLQIHRACGAGADDHGLVTL